MKISYAICTHNEGRIMDSLFNSLISFRSALPIEREIIVLDDESTDELTQQLLKALAEQGVIIHTRKLTNSFAEHKNHLNSLCTGDWILNLDADETVSHDFLHLVDKIILGENPQSIDAYGIPRINIVNGITRAHLKQWNWKLTKIEHKLLERCIYTNMLLEDVELNSILNEYNCIIGTEDRTTKFYIPIVAWPDYQMRLYQNNKIIHWSRSVHEVLTDYQVLAVFPDSPEYAILHIKDIDRQEKQNKLYEGFGLQ